MIPIRNSLRSKCQGPGTRGGGAGNGPPPQRGGRKTALFDHIFFWLIATVAGPVVGFTLIFTDLPLLLINAIGSLVFALLVPHVAIGRTLLYFDTSRPAAKRRRRDAGGSG
jgi:hypothetical protein